MEEMVTFTAEFVGTMCKLFYSFIVIMIFVVIAAIIWLTFGEKFIQKMHQLRTWLF